MSFTQNTMKEIGSNTDFTRLYDNVVQYVDGRVDADMLDQTYIRQSYPLCILHARHTLSVTNQDPFNLASFMFYNPSIWPLSNSTLRTNRL